ncbi:MAG: hypothetical protein OH338_04685 [Candidatus Parvarchaeota archaeon]|nr:hypothetical protein [Candidatus Parvarchaeota archaeon]MCW1295945.1 hypothetical protein [Candidatus Parvarchaeum tengchongense]MCW1299353.1 hypothetical protein [Candidatus Parvarchaeum tengchongense]MCW1312694.1 hypothetical protein [Candidatus Parvarchaeum tengchongense]
MKNYQKETIKRIDDLEKRAIVTTLGTTLLGIGITLIGIGFTFLTLKFGALLLLFYFIAGSIILIIGTIFLIRRDSFAKLVHLKSL